MLRELKSPKQARSLQCSQANVGEQSTRKSKPSETLAPPSGTHEYPVSAVLIHVQTTFLRGRRAAEVYLALTNRSPRMRFGFDFVALPNARSLHKIC